jgi:hypothetical protein
LDAIRRLALPKRATILRPSHHLGLGQSGTIFDLPRWFGAAADADYAGFLASTLMPLSTTSKFTISSLSAAHHSSTSAGV